MYTKIKLQIEYKSWTQTFRKVAEIRLSGNMFLKQRFKLINIFLTRISIDNIKVKIPKTTRVNIKIHVLDFTLKKWPEGTGKCTDSLGFPKFQIQIQIIYLDKAQLKNKISLYKA